MLPCAYALEFLESIRVGNQGHCLLSIEAAGTSIHRKKRFHSSGELNRWRNQTCNKISLGREVIEVARMYVYALRG